MKTIICTLALVAAQTAFATTTEVWEGPGALFDAHGKEIGAYQLMVERTTEGSKVESHITVTLPDGTIQKHQCLTSENGQEGWTLECDYGKGGGSCFGEGLCMSYESDSAGKAFATTIVMDGPSEMRLMRTGLQNGQAVQFFREKLHKRQK